MIRQITAPLRAKLNIRQHPLFRKYFPLLLMAAVSFGILALLDAWLNKKSFGPVAHLCALSALALLLGVLLSWLFEKKILQDHSLLQRSVLLTFAVILGILLFVYISPKAGWKFIEPVYLYVYLPALLLTLLPWVFWRAVVALASVPLLRYTPFVFESLKDVIAAIRFAENEKIGIRWVFEGDFTEVDPSGRYVFRTFTPADLKEISLAQLFKGALSLHNITECPQMPVDFKSGSAFYGWEFYDYPYFFRPGRKRYLNPHKSVKKQRLHFRRISEEERARSAIKLVPKFRAGSIYVIRSK
ncbi:MAG: hypothetical protein HUU01_13545 [Saprospiraceae bacterium]|nr:hypothetical protein [Saprospiraceae bacterium]